MAAILLLHCLLQDLLPYFSVFLMQHEAPLSTKGALKSLRMARRIGGRRTLVGLIGGAALSLLILAFTPHPVPNTRSQTLGHRRIQQEEDDYTGPKIAAPAVEAAADEAAVSPKNLLSSSDSGSAAKLDMPAPLQNDTERRNILPPPQSSTQSVSKSKQEDTGVGEVVEVTNQNKRKKKLPSLLGLSPVDAIMQMADIPRTKNENHILSKAQETAITALQHGFKLTEGQKKLLEKLSPTERQEVETKVSKIRIMQEKAYLQQLRAKRQIRPKRDGGEEVISTPQTPVRFPATLKKVHPRDWLPQYKLFLNLTHYPWSKSSSCSNYSITFKLPDTLPRKALASFPSSGNTWIRYLVEGATGMFTGSLYDDTSLTKKGMYGEGIVFDSGMTILQKSHGYTTGDSMKLSHEERVLLNHMEQLQNQGVIVIRNPFKALISHRHLDTGGHTGYAPKAHFLGKGWTEFVTLKIMLWKEFYIDWLNHSKPENLHLTFYEKVKENLVGEMRDILTYLNLPVDEDRLQCLGQNSDGLFKRKPSKNVPLTFNPFTQELKDLVYEAVDDVNAVLRAKGKEELPLDRYEFYDPHEAEVARYLRIKRNPVS